MHYIQAKILDQLLYNDIVRYSHLKPDDIESNHFSYHLKELQRDKLVAKVDGGYTLAPKGLAYVDRLSHQYMKPRHQPKIITQIHITNSTGELLLFRRNYQPYIHRWGAPSGKLHLDETIGQAAKRELKEKTGLSGIALAHRGIINLEIKQGGFVISQVMAHLFTGKAPEAELMESDRGALQWAKLSTLKDSELMPGMRKMNSLLRRPDFFYDELSLKA